LTTDFNSTFENNSSIDLIGSKMAEACANSVYKKSGLGPKDIQVVELHDCFSANELCTYEAIGLCEVGKAGEAIDNNDFTYGGKRQVVNPSGGLISKGHPLGATGLAQCAELCW
jgi:acetyl-CoA acetyltransferase